GGTSGSASSLREVQMGCKKEDTPVEEQGVGDYADEEILRRGVEDCEENDVCRNGSTITKESKKIEANLKKTEVEQLTEEVVRPMVQEGDLDGDGALNEHEFCVLMI
ncbi:hypothetical protein KI387_009051, partial [Taxus chinensis]